MDHFFKKISNNEIIVAVTFIALILFLIMIRDILAIIFISYIVMAALLPFVNFLKRRKIPHLLAVLITFFIAITLSIVVIFPLIPFFTIQFQSLFTSFPHILDKAAGIIGIKISASQINDFFSKDLGKLGFGAFTLTLTIFGGIFSLLTSFIICFYMVLDHEKLRKDAAGLFEGKSKEKALSIIEQIEDKLGSWFRGQIMLSITIGFMTWIALTILGIPFALPLALLTALLEVIPTIGPIISSIPAIIVALSISPTLTIFTAVTYLFIQMFENNVLVPKIMQRQVGLNPIIVIIAVIVGTTVMGIMGGLLSVPFITVLVVLFNNFRSQR